MSAWRCGLVEDIRVSAGTVGTVVEAELLPAKILRKVVKESGRLSAKERF